MISDRINRISSDKHIFDRAATFYNDALSASGHKDKITFNKISKNHLVQPTVQFERQNECRKEIPQHR